jgi:translation initiation factor 5A
VPDWLSCENAKAHNALQVDVSEDGFLSLMSDDGSTKDDVKVPDGEVGDKINKLFVEDGKDTST